MSLFFSGLSDFSMPLLIFFNHSHLTSLHDESEIVIINNLWQRNTSLNNPLHFSYNSPYKQQHSQLVKSLVPLYLFLSIIIIYFFLLQTHFSTNEIHPLSVPSIFVFSSYSPTPQIDCIQFFPTAPIRHHPQSIRLFDHLVEIQEIPTAVIRHHPQFIRLFDHLVKIQKNPNRGHPPPSAVHPPFGHLFKIQEIPNAAIRHHPQLIRLSNNFPNYRYFPTALIRIRSHPPPSALHPPATGAVRNVKNVKNVTFDCHF